MAASGGGTVGVGASAGGFEAFREFLADQQGSIVLADEGRSAYRIVIDAKPAPSTRYAADDANFTPAIRA